MIALWLFVKGNWRLLAVAAATLALISGIAIWRAGIFRDGQESVKSAVNAETIKTIDRAAKDKERADEDVRKLPYSDRVDDLR